MVKGGFRLSFIVIHSHTLSIKFISGQIEGQLIGKDHVAPVQSDSPGPHSLCPSQPGTPGPRVRRRFPFGNTPAKTTTMQPGR